MPAVKRRLRLAALLLLCLPALAHGLAADRDRPITVESDTATYNEKEGISVYQGNVYLTQGTLKLHGDILTVYSTDDHIQKAILTGDPATGVQRPDGADANQHAEAQRIEYQADRGLLILTGKARVWETGGREVRSEEIVYDINKNTVNAGGGNTSGRVHITLQPNTRPQKPPAETSAP
jgi:lipopolysaccharide export system protein LptA